MRAASLLVAAAGLVACGASTPSAETPEQPPARTLTPVDVEALAQYVAALRGLPRRAPVPTAFVDDATFFGAMEENYDRKTQGAGPAGGPEHSRVGQAFDLVPPPKDQGAALADEQILAFYDEWNHSILVRAEKAADEPLVRSTLVHEIEHALQHQNLPFPNLGAIADDDARAAHKAVLEGDAVLTQVVFAAAEELAPPRAAVVRAIHRVTSGQTDAPDETPSDRMPGGKGKTSALATAPPRMREPLVFPYFGGLAFLGDLYRTGGFPLVDRVFSAPPTTTEQVLHTAKYIAGEPPIDVPAPAPPPGFRTLGTGKLGELETSAFLAQCTPLVEARAAAAGWGGDAFTVATGPGGAVALIWDAIWDDETEAMELERALRAPACMARDPQMFVARSGARVILTRGLAPPLAAATATRLVAAPVGKAAPRPPLGPVDLKPRPAFARAVSEVRNGWFLGGRLGLAAAIPPGVTAEVKQGSLLLSRRGVSPVVGAIEASFTSPSPEGLERSFAKVVRDFAASFPGRRLVETGRAQTPTPVGTASDRAFVLEGTPITVRVMLLPLCRAGTLIVMESWVHPEARALLDAWLASFRALPGSPPVCAEILTE